MADDSREVDGFVFATAADAQIAREEIKKIKYISDKLNYEEPESILEIYNKMITNRIFVTPIGQNFLRGMQMYLYGNAQIDDSKIMNIPLYIIFGQRAGELSKLDKIYVQPKEKKNYHKQYITSVWVCITLVIAVLLMFTVSLNAKNPNIVNYKTALENQYSEWEQELTERETAVREKEAELQMTPEN